MAWRRSSRTGEWEEIDLGSDDTRMMLAIPYDARYLDEGLHEGYRDPNLRVLPLPSRGDPRLDVDIEYDNAGGYTDPDLARIPAAHPDDMRYRNYDPSILDRWELGVAERGNEIRTTGVGTFEVDAGGRIVSTMPLPYPMN